MRREERWATQGGGAFIKSIMAVLCREEREGFAGTLEENWKSPDKVEGETKKKKK